MNKKIISTALFIAVVCAPGALCAEDCSESYGGRLAASSPSAWAEWCGKCGGTVIRTSGSPYCRPGSNWGKSGGGETIGDGPYQFTATGDLRVDAPLTFLSAFFNEMDKESKKRAAREKSEREAEEYLGRIEAEQRAAEALRQRELSYERLSGVIKGMEGSGELNLKGMGKPEPFKIKTGTPSFNQPANPRGETTLETNLKLKTGEPVHVSTVAGVPVDGALRIEAPLKQKYSRLEEEMKASEERLAKVKKAKEEAARLKSLAEERLKEAREKLKAPKEGGLPELKTGLPDTGSKSDDNKLAEAEKLLQDALDFDKKVDEELANTEKDIKSRRQSLDQLKKEIEAGEKDNGNGGQGAGAGKG